MTDYDYYNELKIKATEGILSALKENFSDHTFEFGATEMNEYYTPTSYLFIDGQKSFVHINMEIIADITAVVGLDVAFKELEEIFVKSVEYALGI